MNTRDPVPPLIWHVVGGMGRREAPTQSKTEVGGRDHPEVIRVGEVPLTPTSYSTLESRPYTAPGPHNRVNPIGRGVGEPAPKL